MATTVVSELLNIIGFKVDEGEVRKVENTFKRIQDKATSAGKSLSLALTVPFATLSALSLKAASDAVETQNKFNQVFSGISDDANAFASSLAKDLRRSEGVIQDNLSSLQSFSIGMGFAQDEAFGLSKKLQGLIFDFASFNNVSDDEAFQRFLSGLSGSGEVFDRFGINIKQSALELELQAMGLATSAARATEMQKVLARVSIIEKALGRQGAIGDAQRTMLEFASAIKSTRAVIADLLADFGAELLPLARRVLNTFNEVATELRTSLTPEIKRMILFVGFLVAAIGPLLLIVGGASATIAFLAGAFSKLAIAAAAANTSVLLFIAKFVLIGAAIASVIALLGLLIEDIIVFQRDGNSLIGFLVDGFQDLAKMVKAAGFSILEDIGNIFGSIRNTFDAFINFVTGVFTARWRFAVRNFVRILISSVATAARGIGLIVQGVADTLAKLGIVDGRIDVNAAIQGAEDFANTAIRNLTATRSGLESNGFNARRIATESARNFNVNSNITLNFPVGTDQGTIDTADQQIRKAVRDELLFEARKIAVDNPQLQR
tara:strand:+ start:9734 stop:11380 length:1647 start_codon:yes stop_codon:yes gene_type:complete